MIPEILALTCMFLASVFGQTDPPDLSGFSPDVLSVMGLVSTLNFVDVFDGPASVSNAPTTPTTNSQPTLAQLKYYANYANAMYCQYQLNDLSCDICQQFKGDVFQSTVIMNNDTDNTVLITVSKTRQEIVVAYRGTNNIWNIVLDLDTVAVTYPNLPPGIKLHAGFYVAVMSLYQQVVENVGYLLASPAFANYKIVLTGHSLGGAMARVTEFLLLANNQFPRTKYETYTFGEPRSGNKAYADYMNTQKTVTARVVNNGDIVPHVPPTSAAGTKLLGDNFVHVQVEYWYVSDSAQRFCNTATYEDATCSMSVGPGYQLIDHLSYLGVSFATCDAEQPAVLFAIPFSILQPVGTIPPLPGFISSFLSAAVNWTLGLLTPIFSG